MAESKYYFLAPIEQTRKGLWVNALLIQPRDPGSLSVAVASLSSNINKSPFDYVLDYSSVPSYMREARGVLGVVRVPSERLPRNQFGIIPAGSSVDLANIGRWVGSDLQWLPIQNGSTRIAAIEGIPGLYQQFHVASQDYFKVTGYTGAAESKTSIAPTLSPEPVAPAPTPEPGMTFDDLFKSEVPVATMIPCQQDPRIEAVRIDEGEQSFTQIGYTYFQIPPNSITVNVEHGLQAVEMMRTNSAVKQLDAKVVTQIGMTFTVAGPDEYSVVVQGLLEQFRRCPFLPVFNTMLKFGHNIDALALTSMGVSTTQGYPGVFEVTLNAQPFEWRSYLHTYPDYDKLFCWPIFQMWCKMRAAGKFTPLPYDLSGNFVLQLPDTEMIEAQNEMGRGTVLDSNPIGCAMDRDLLEGLEGTIAAFQRKPHSPHTGVVYPNLRIVRATDGGATIYLKAFSKIGQLFLLEEAQKSNSEIRAVTVVPNENMTAHTCQVYPNQVTQISSSELSQKIQSLTSMMSEPDGVGHVWPLAQFVEFEIPAESEILQKFRAKVTAGFVAPGTEFLSWDRFDLGEVLVIESINTQIGNNIATVHPRTGEGELHQFMGGSDAAISLIGYVYGTEALAQITKAIRDLEQVAKKFRARAWGMDVAGYFKVENEILNSQGIEAIIPLSITSQIVEGYPELYSVKMDFIQFKETQRSQESSSYLNPRIIEWMKSTEGQQLLKIVVDDTKDTTGEQLDLDKIVNAHDVSDLMKITRLNSPRARWALSVLQKLIIQQIEVYPDLELPTKGEYNIWVDHIKEYFKSPTTYDRLRVDAPILDIISDGGIPSVARGEEYDSAIQGLKKYKSTFGFCDPDFFLGYSDVGAPELENKQLRGYLQLAEDSTTPVSTIAVKDTFGGSVMNSPDTPLGSKTSWESPGWEIAAAQVKSLDDVINAGEDLRKSPVDSLDGLPAYQPFTQTSPGRYDPIFSATWGDQFKGDYDADGRTWEATFGKAPGTFESNKRGIRSMISKPDVWNALQKAVDATNTRLTSATTGPLTKYKPDQRCTLDYGTMAAIVFLESGGRAEAVGPKTTTGSGRGVGQFKTDTWKGARTNPQVVALAGGLENIPASDEEAHDLQKGMNLLAAYLCTKLNDLTHHPVVMMAAHITPGRAPKMIKAFKEAPGSKANFYLGNTEIQKRIELGLPLARYVNATLNAKKLSPNSNEAEISALADQAAADKALTRYVYVVDVINGYTKPSEGVDWVMTYLKPAEAPPDAPNKSVYMAPRYPDLACAGTGPTGPGAAFSYRIRLYKQHLVEGAVPTNQKEDTKYTKFGTTDAIKKYHWSFVGNPSAMLKFPPGGPEPDITLTPTGELLVPQEIIDSVELSQKLNTTKTGVYISMVPPNTTAIAEGGGVNFAPPVDTKFRDMLVDIKNKTEVGRLIRAYPGYIVMVIDGARWIGREQLWPHFYGEFGIQSITVTSTREDPTDVAEVVFSNLYNRLTSQTAYNALRNRMDTRSNWSIPAIMSGMEQFYNLIPVVGSGEITQQTKDRWNRYAKTMMLKPGARLHIRWGYSSNPNDLPVAFNGTISEVPDTDNVAIVTALGDGAELSRPIPLTGDYMEANTQGEKEWRNTGHSWSPREPKDIIADLFQPSSWILSKLTQRIYYSDNKYGICHFGMGDFTTSAVSPFIAEPGATYGYTHGETMVNVFTSDTSSLNRGYGHWYWILSAMVAHLNGAHFFGVSVSDPTPWRVIETCRMGVPDYVCAVRPFELRSTVFFGRQDYPFCHRYTMSGEPLRQVLGATRATTLTSRAVLPSGPPKVSDLIDEKIKNPGGKTYIDIGSDDAKDADKYYTMMDTKTFAQFHLIASDYNLLSNYVRASSEQVYTNCQAKFSYSGNNTQEGDVMMADSDIFPEVQKTKIISSGIFTAPFHGAQWLSNMGTLVGMNAPPAAANTAAVQTIRDDLGKMYQGVFLIAGDGYIRPWDFALVNDSASLMNGVIQVRGVTSSMTMENGFISAVEPDCLVLATNDILGQWIVSAAHVVGCYFGAFAIRKLAAAVAQSMVINPLLRSTHTILGYDQEVLAAQSATTVEGGVSVKAEVNAAYKEALAARKASQEAVNKMMTKLAKAQQDLTDIQLIPNNPAEAVAKERVEQLTRQLDELKTIDRDAYKAVRHLEGTARSSIRALNPTATRGGRFLKKVSDTFKSFTNSRPIQEAGQRIRQAYEAQPEGTKLIARVTKAVGKGVAKPVRWLGRGISGGSRAIFYPRLEEIKVDSVLQMADESVIKVTNIVRDPTTQEVLRIEAMVQTPGQTLQVGTTELVRGPGGFTSGGQIRSVAQLKTLRAQLGELRAAAEASEQSLAALRSAGPAASAADIAAAETALKEARAMAKTAQWASNALKIGKIVGSLGLQLVLTCVGDYITRKLAARQCVVIFPLNINGLEFSAGINGHMGSVYGDKPSYEDMALATFFNPLATPDEDGPKIPGSWALRALGAVFEFVVPVNGEAFDPYRWKRFGEGTSTITASPQSKDQSDAFDAMIRQMVIRAKIRKRGGSFETLDSSGGSNQTAKTAKSLLGGRLFEPIYPLKQVTGSSHFGDTARRSSPHTGQDYAAAVGTPIMASGPGIVTRVAVAKGSYGLHIIIKHDGGLETIYAHLSAISPGIREGSHVAAREQIGLSGGAKGDPNAGNSSGPHLHFAVRKDGAFIDPEGILP